MICNPLDMTDASSTDSDSGAMFFYEADDAAGGEDDEDPLAPMQTVWLADGGPSDKSAEDSGIWDDDPNQSVEGERAPSPKGRDVPATNVVESSEMASMGQFEDTHRTSKDFRCVTC